MSLSCCFTLSMVLMSHVTLKCSLTVFNPVVIKGIVVPLFLSTTVSSALHEGVVSFMLQVFYF